MTPTLPPAVPIRLLTGRQDTDDRDRSPITLSTYDLGSGPAVVFCHGFPDLALGWRHQLVPVARAGFRAIAPDQRGYGGSTAPASIHDYGLTELTGDLVGLLDALDVDRAVFVGHDWGGFVAWAMPVLHPERVLGVAGICTPYMPFPSVAKHLEIVGGEVERQYVAWFQEPGVAEAEMDPKVRPILTRILRTGAPLEDLLRIAFAHGRLDMNPFLNPEKWPPLGEPLAPPDVLEEYFRTYERTGFGGGISWYRNIDRNAAEHPDVGRRPLEIPCLMLTAELDPGLRPEFAEPMRALCSDLEMHHVPKVGHWVQQEAPDVVNGHLLTWLRRFAA